GRMRLNRRAGRLTLGGPVVKALKWSRSGWSGVLLGNGVDGVLRVPPQHAHDAVILQTPESTARIESPGVDTVDIIALHGNQAGKRVLWDLVESMAMSTLTE